MSKAKGFHKKPSKRITCKKRYRIEKKVRDHHKKMKKLAKKKGNSSSGKKKQLISMPRSAPFDLEWDGETVPGANLKKTKVEEAQVVVPSTVPSMDIESLVSKKSDTDLVEGVPSSSSLSQQMTRRLKEIKSQGQPQEDADMDVDLVAETSLGNKKKLTKKNRRKPTPRQQKQGDYDVDRDFE